MFTGWRLDDDEDKDGVGQSGEREHIRGEGALEVGAALAREPGELLDILTGHDLDDPGAAVRVFEEAIQPGAEGETRAWMAAENAYAALAARTQERARGGMGAHGIARREEVSLFVFGQGRQDCVRVLGRAAAAGDRNPLGNARNG